MREVFALQELHHDVRPPVGEHAEIEDVNDVVAIDARRRLRLALEALDDAWLVDGVLAEDLDGDAAADANVDALVDRCPRALPEVADDPVLGVYDVAVREVPRVLRDVDHERKLNVKIHPLARGKPVTLSGVSAGKRRFPPRIGRHSAPGQKRPKTPPGVTISPVVGPTRTLGRAKYT